MDGDGNQRGINEIINTDQFRNLYHEYLKSPDWRNKANQCKARDNHRCQDCGSRRKLQAHHLTYSDLRWVNGMPDWSQTPLTHLVTLCRGCHKNRHPEAQDAPQRVKPLKKAKNHKKRHRKKKRKNVRQSWSVPLAPSRRTRFKTHPGYGDDGFRLAISPTAKTYAEHEAERIAALNYKPDAKLSQLQNAIRTPLARKLLGH